MNHDGRRIGAPAPRYACTVVCCRNVRASDAAAGYLEDIRKAELEKAVEMGLYDKARENAEAIIRESLAQFSGYTVAFE